PFPAKMADVATRFAGLSPLLPSYSPVGRSDLGEKVKRVGRKGLCNRGNTRLSYTIEGRAVAAAQLSGVNGLQITRRRARDRRFGAYCDYQAWKRAINVIEHEG